MILAFKETQKNIKESYRRKRAEYTEAMRVSQEELKEARQETTRIHQTLD